MKSKMTGRDQARCRYPYVVDRKNATAIFEFEKKWPAGCRLEPGAVMVSSVVVANCGVIAAGGNVQEVARGILEKEALDVHAKDIVGASFENDFREPSPLLRNIRSDEQVELSQGERCGVSLMVVPMECDVAESSDLHQSFARVHVARLGQVPRTFGSGLS